MEVLVLCVGFTHLLVYGPQSCFFLFFFCPFNIDLAGSVTHPLLSTLLPSQIGEPPGRKQHLQRPITSLIAYQIQFGIVVNEAKVLVRAV